MDDLGFEASTDGERINPAMLEGDTDPSTPNNEAPIGPIEFLGKYALIQKLATGGMAEIWIARQSGPFGFQKLVALKRILPHLAVQSSFRQMFLDEARTTTLLTHPNVVQVHEFGEFANVPFMSMELVLGESASALVWRAKKNETPLGPTLAARIVADAAKGLDYAHGLRSAQGEPLEIVHRDVSPQNLLISYDGDVKILDFGIAKAATNLALTRTGTLKGKFSYMSPEQCRADPLDRRSDVFSLGVVLYELATTTRLFKHESELMILDMITKGRVDAPSKVLSSPEDPFDEHFDAIVLRALHKDPARRYQTAGELRGALEEWLSFRPQSTSIDLGRKMRTLFRGEREKKLRLLERASKIEIPVPILPSAPTVAPVHPPLPLPVPVAPPMPPLPIPTQRSYWPIVGALAFLLGSIAIFYAVDPPTPTSSVPRHGAIAVESTPTGALVLVNGKRISMGDAWARTPIEKVTNLSYGTTYDLRLEKDGFKPFTTQVTMNAETDATVVRAVLEPILGTVIVELAGDDETVGISIDGRSPRMDRKFREALVPGSHRITTSQPNCAATPETFELTAGGEVKVTVACQRDIRRVPPNNNRDENNEVRQVAQPANACALIPGAKPGRVNITTEPYYAQIYYGDKLLGEAPLSTKLPAGCLTLRAIVQEEGIDTQMVIQVPPSELTRFRWPLLDPPNK